LLLGALGVLVAVMALSLLWAGDRVLALKETLKWGEALAVLMCAPRWLRQWRALAVVLGAVVAVALLEALLGLAQGTIFSLDLPVSADRGVRVVGTFGQPNPYSGDLNLALPLVLALAAWARDLRVRLAGMLLALPLGGALALAQSRGALLGLAGALVALALLGWPRIRRWCAGVAVLGAVGLAGALATGRLTVAALAAKLGWRPLTDTALSVDVTDANFSTIERLAHWAAALRMFAAHPLTGVGAGNYAVVYARYQVPRWHLALGHAHNLYLNMAAEVGIVGALAYLVFVGAGIWLAWPHPVAPPADGEQGSRGATGQGSRRVPVERRDGATGGLGAGFPCRDGMGPLLLGCLGVLIAVALHNLVDDLATHDMLIEQVVILACVQMLPLARFK
jgi:O-antigen ligase